jgi:serine/threonine protein kinase
MIALTARQKMRLILGIAKGMQAMYDARLSHGDLKTGNILVHEVVHGIYNALIADFDSAREMKKDEHGKFIAKDEGVFVHGTPGYYSDLEACGSLREIGGQPKPMTEQADVYAFAMVAIEIITGIEPFDSSPSRYAGNRNNWTEMISNEASESGFTYQLYETILPDKLDQSFEQDRSWTAGYNLSILKECLMKWAHPNKPSMRSTFAQIVEDLEEKVEKPDGVISILPTPRRAFLSPPAHDLISFSQVHVQPLP